MKKKKNDPDDSSFEDAIGGFITGTFLAIFQTEPEKGQSRKDFIRGKILAFLIIAVIAGLVFLSEFG